MNHHGGLNNSYGGGGGMNDPYAAQSSFMYDNQYDGYADGAVDGYYDTGDQMIGSEMAAGVAEGSYFPILPPYMPHIQSSAVSTLAIDPIADAVYVGGHTSPITRKRHHIYPSLAEQRAAMVATHSFTDGTLYSACAAHSEARKEVLHNVSNSIFGNASKQSTPSRKAQIIKIPNHAYRAPYDPVGTSQLDPFPKKYHLGVTKILPFASKVASGNNESEKTEGYYCSVSPSAVRVHTRGGLQVSNSIIQGMVSGTFHHGYQSDADEKMISSSATHITVGGVSTTRAGTNLHCMDLYSSSLKAVASHVVISDNESNQMCISDLVTNHQTTNIIAGCSDGTLRIFDGSWRGRSYNECAKVKAHGGGVVHIATSGNLICTTGYSSRSPVNYSGLSSELYAFPDEHVLVFDIRYLGRGGIPHPFSGLKGGPRFASFIPGVDGNSEERILAFSGQPGGGIQIMTPFDSLSGTISDTNDYFNPPMDPSESMTAISVVGKNMAIGTSYGNVVHYQMAGYEQVISKAGKVDNKLSEEQLEHPSFLEAPALSIEPHMLIGTVSRDAPSMSMFNSYVMSADPMVTPTSEDGKHNSYSFGFGPLSNDTFRPAGKRILSKKLEDLLSSEPQNEYLASISASKLGFDLIKQNLTDKNRQEIMNANKLLYGKELANICYNTNADPRKKDRKGNDRDNVDKRLPERYRNKDRPPHTMFTVFDFAALNNTLFPGYDYPPNASNSFVGSVLLMLYFVPEIQRAMLSCQQWGVTTEAQMKKSHKNTSLLSAELGFLFHQMRSISAHAMCHPKPSGTKEDPCRPVVGTFVPSNFLSAFITMPEASNFALLDDSPAVADFARRPEAFYLFLLHHLDKELSNGSDLSTKGNRDNKKVTKTKQTKLIDSLQGLDAVSMNETNSASGTPTASLRRSYTVELSYEPFLNLSEQQELPAFRKLLQYSLSKHVITKKFETQRRIVTSLPKILSLSCACAGVHGEDRLPLWRKTSEEQSHWLPEIIEVEIDDRGNVLTREMVKKYGSTEVVWEEFRGKPLPDSVVSTLKHVTKSDFASGQRCARYRLEMVLTYLNDKANEGGESDCGRHIVHARIPKSYKKNILLDQLENIKGCASDPDRINKLTLLRDVTAEDFVKRLQYVENEIEELDDNLDDEWILFNGPNVSKTSVDDALAFHVPFKEPCIIMFRQIDSSCNDAVVDPDIDIPDSLWANSPLCPDPPHKGDTLAFDAEFVQVENESSMHTATGSKVVVREGRNAVGRISLLDCDSGHELIDDHVIPREPVVDYLTRFSGITKSDLQPGVSRHHLITARNAYLKMRYLVDRGCKFVGHGLRQDFKTVNLFVPPCQIIDTVDIFRIENRRYISLRFLVNYLLGRDMQIEIHDSIEDSRAANELYQKALELKAEGIFQENLRKIYERGQQIDWKVAELNPSSSSTSR